MFFVVNESWFLIQNFLTQINTTTKITALPNNLTRRLKNYKVLAMMNSAPIIQKSSSKQQIFDLFEKTRLEFLQNCRWIAVRIAKEHGGYVNIDQVREQVTTPDNVDPRVYGAVFNRTDFEKTGYIQTTRKTSHARPIANFFWKGYTKWKSSTPVYKEQLNLI